MDLGLKNKKAVVLAGAKGIGFAIAKSLKQEDGDVAILARVLKKTT